MDFIIVNGEIVKKPETGFTPFFFEEPFVISQKMWFGFGGIPMFQEDIQNIKQLFNTLNTKIPALFNDERELFRITKRMLNKNKLYRSGIITFLFFFGKTNVNTVISSVGFEEFDFPFSKQGLIVNFSEFVKFTGSPLNKYGFFNVPLWTTATSKIRETNYQNSIFLNEKGIVCDCISANIFMIKGKVLYTPAPETGCYIDTFRNSIIEIASKLNLKITESDAIENEEVMRMNEVFLVSGENGIQWVLGVGTKRFVHHYSEKIHELLNDYLKKKVT
jgi:branched-subunit amino acid aminotransferase/4-amino-4-deoxychorismate lyase